MIAYQNYIVRFRPRHSTKMYYVECDTKIEALNLRDWFRDAGAESAIGHIENKFYLPEEQE